jgi:flavin-binding protein dodecin
MRSNQPVACNRSIAGNSRCAHTSRKASRKLASENGAKRKTTTRRPAYPRAAEQDIGAQDTRRLAIDFGEPARIVELAHDRRAGFIALDCGLDAISAPWQSGHVPRRPALAIANTRRELIDSSGLSGPSGSPVLVVVAVQMEDVVAESVYKIIEIVGTSPTSWEKAAAAAVERAAQTLRDLRVAQVCEQDIVITDGKVEAYRVRLKISFKYED